MSTTDPEDNVLELNLTDETMSFSNNLRLDSQSRLAGAGG